MNGHRFEIHTHNGVKYVSGVHELEKLLISQCIDRHTQVIDRKTNDRRQVFEVLKISRHRSQSQIAEDLCEQTLEMVGIGEEILKLLKAGG